MAKNSAPDIFMGMTHQWCGQYDFCDKMPADLEKTYDQNLPKYMVDVGKWKGARYGIPIEHGNFQQMYINTDMFKKAGLNPDDPPKTFDVWLADMKKLTITDAKGGEPTQVGFAIRSKGAPVGITDKFLPFAHAWGARMLSPDLDKATGYANSPQMVAALTFFGDLVNKDKVGRVSRSATPKMRSARNARLSSSASRGSFGWLKKNAPDVNFKVYALPCEKVCPGAGALFPWTDLVLQEQPEQASGLGVHAVHQQSQGRHGASPVTGDPPRAGRRTSTARTSNRGPTISPPKTCWPSRCRQPTSIRNRTSWLPRSAKRSWACCSARDSQAVAGRSGRENGSHPQGLAVC